MNHYTYILTPYQPIRDMKKDDLTSFDILIESTKKSYPDLDKINQKIFEKIGKNNTIYGIQKLIDSDEISLEYYFYNHNELWKGNDVLSWQHLRETLSNNLNEHLKRDIPVDFNFGMLSLDIPKNDMLINDLDVYYMEPRKGFCLRWNNEGLFNKNKYSFFGYPNEVENELINKNIPSGALLFGNHNVWNESICISLKKNKYWSIYYCQVNIDILIRFLHKLNYPSNIINYFTDNKSKLDHMLFDLGYDFNLYQGGFIQVIKGGFYGYF